MKTINLIILLGCAVSWCNADDSREDSLQEDLPFTTEATRIDECPVLQNFERATSVHRLRPSDIEVVAAIGDRYGSQCHS